jgi:hypothetical protein
LPESNLSYLVCQPVYLLTKSFYVVHCTCPYTGQLKILEQTAYTTGVPVPAILQEQLLAAVVPSATAVPTAVALEVPSVDG